MSARWRQPENLAQVYEGLRSDYAAAKSSRFRRRRTGLVSTGSGADYHYRSEADYLRLIETARDMDRNDVIVGQTIDRAVLNTIRAGIGIDPGAEDQGPAKLAGEKLEGTGVQLGSDSGDGGLNAELEARFNEWGDDAEACDVAGEMTWADFQSLGLRQTFADGDIVFLGLRDGGLQAVEAHRIRTPSGTRKNVVHGVLLSERRRREEYWITADDIDPNQSLKRVGDIRRYPVRDDAGHRVLFHVYNPKRVSQTRGVTALAPIFDVCGMFEDIQFAKLVQQQIVSCFAIFRERESNFQSPGTPQAFGPQTTETLASGSTRVVEGIAPGIELTGYPGEKLAGFSPSVPNAEYFEHVRLILTLVGANLGLPLFLVLPGATEPNLSAWRGAYDQAKLGFEHNQRLLWRRLIFPVYSWKLRQFAADDPAIARAAERLGSRFFRVKPSFPAWPYIQPLDDAKADDLRRKCLQSSPRRLAAERGANIDDIHRETTEDNGHAIRLAIAEAQAITDETGEEIDWREVLFLTGDQKADNTPRASDEKTTSAADGAAA